MKGLSNAETDLLRLIFTLTPWRRDKLSRAVGKYLDGDSAALDAASSLRLRLENAIDTVNAERVLSP